jgi:type IV fimbrial biogenesis protein FimT
VFAVLATLAVPNMATMIRQQKIKNASFDLTSVVMLARSEAIKRNAPINVSSQAAGWNAGWSVAPAAGTAIRSEDALAGITITEANTNTQFTFGGAGRMTSPTSLAFTIKSSTTSSAKPLCVKVTATGHTQTTQGACS